MTPSSHGPDGTVPGTSTPPGASPDASTDASTDATHRGTVTLLFSDIEGSTRLLHEVGDAYAPLLDAHRRVMRGAIAAAHGREVDTAGDGFFVAFQRARDAIAAAAAAQVALAEHEWPAGVVVRVRIGIHTGEPTATHGSFVGMDVHRAARICAAAHGGQVLLSRATRELVGSDLPDGSSVRDLGSYSLKDIAVPVQLYQLDISGLPSEFPALRTTGDRLDGLPVQLTSLIGRDRDIEAVSGLLRAPHVRLVSLVGPGGTGKTRLSIEAARRAGADFRDGVAFAPLASIDDPALVPATISRSLHLSEDPTRTHLERIKEHLRDREILMVLDNFEHVTAAASVVGELLSASPRSKVLVTSRIALRLGAEHEYPVSPLDLPRPRGLPHGRSEPVTVPELLENPSVALFVERARSVRHAFELTAENASTITDICVRLDGLPLAIELAAARIKLLSPRDLLRRLDRRLDILAGGARDRPERHQALRQTIALSYDLLEADERAFFRRMAVFMGGCSLEAAAHVCISCEELDDRCRGCGDGSTDPLEAVSALVDHSLLLRGEGPDGESRFRMLETIREYGLERLMDEGEDEGVRRAHTTFFLGLAERALPELTGPAQVEWMDRLEVEHDNLRVSLAWAEANDARVALRLAVALWRFWVARGHMREGRVWLERVLALPGEADAVRLRALNAAGTLAHEIGDLASAQARLHETLVTARALGDRRSMALALNNLGWLAAMSSRMDESKSHSEEAYDLFQELGDQRGMAVAMNNLGWRAQIRGRMAEAASFFERGLALRREAGDLRGACFAQTYLGWALAQLGDPERGRRHIEEALGLVQGLSDHQGMGNAMGNLGRLTLDLGDFSRATDLLEEGVSNFRQAGNRAAVALTEVPLGLSQLAEGRIAEARRTLESARSGFEEIDVDWGVSDAWCGLGWVALAEGDAHGATTCFKRALAFREQLGDDPGIAECNEGLARVAAGHGDHAGAARLLGQAEALRERARVPLPRRSLADHDRLKATLREVLGASFDAEWSAGRANVPDVPDE